MQLSHTVLMIEFISFKEDEIMLLYENGDLKVLNTITRILIKKANYIGIRPNIMRFHPFIEGRFALVCADGVSLYGEMSHDNA